MAKTSRSNHPTPEPTPERHAVARAFHALRKAFHKLPRNHKLAAAEELHRRTGVLLENASTDAAHRVKAESRHNK